MNISHTELQIGDIIWFEELEVDCNVYGQEVEWSIVCEGWCIVSKLHFDLLSDFYPITYVEMDEKLNSFTGAWEELASPKLWKYEGRKQLTIKEREEQC